MNVPILTYLLVRTVVKGVVTSVDVERYTTDEFAKAFDQAERLRLANGLQLVRESSVYAESQLVYDDMVANTTRRGDELAALDRADKLIEWMMPHIGQMSPGAYGECYADLNQHCLFMEKRKRGMAA